MNNKEVTGILMQRCNEKHRKDWKIIRNCNTWTILIVGYLSLKFGKLTIHAPGLKSIFCLHMIDTLMHYSETQSTRQQIARFAYTDGFLQKLLNHEGIFHGPKDINRTALGTKVHLTAV